ncbi:MAG: hypothetical protein V1871_05625 [Planctomycetota bacterium]
MRLLILSTISNYFDQTAPNETNLNVHISPQRTQSRNNYKETPPERPKGRAGRNSRLMNFQFPWTPYK